MSKAMRGDDVFALCRAARPPVPDDLVSPHSPAAVAMLEEILSMPIETQPAETQSAEAQFAEGHVAEERRPLLPRSRVRAAIALIAAAGVTAAVAVGILVGGEGNSSPKSSRSGAAIVRIAATSNAVLAGSGRARVTFDLQKETTFEQKGTSEVAWSGRDLEMNVNIEGHDGRSTKIVDGEAYSYDGPKGGEKRWVHETTASPTNGRALFDADPRALMSILDPAAQFAEVGTETIDGVPTRQLHANALSELPVVNLGLFPDAANTRVTSLDLWVGADDVVRRLDLALRRTNTKEGQTAATDSRDSTYSVTFFDLGVPIEITAPVNAEPGMAK